MKINSKQILSILVTILLLVIGSKLKYTYNEMPYTMQTFALGLVVIYFDLKQVLLGLLFYFLLGTVLPVFAGKGYGSEFYNSVSAGYLFAFFIAVFVLIKIHQTQSLYYAIAIFFVAHILILIVGALYLLYKQIPFSYTAYNGFLYLIPWAFTKSILLGLVYKYVYLPNKNKPI